MADLQLALKGVYFDQIMNGTKNFEYRLCTEYWSKRLVHRNYDRLILTRGYPKKTCSIRRHILSYRGFEIQTITHEHFGVEPVGVFAIRVSA